jgi:hypothetical protein
LFFLFFFNCGILAAQENEVPISSTAHTSKILEQPQEKFSLPDKLIRIKKELNFTELKEKAFQFSEIVLKYWRQAKEFIAYWKKSK